MLFTSLLIAAVASVPAFATPTPTTTAAPVTVTPFFCTDASYSPSDPYPYGVPLGTGFCAGPAVVIGQCYDWTSFPTAETGPLVHNMSFAHIGNDFSCNLYKIKHCHGDFFTASAGDEDLNNPELADVSYNDEVDSFRCLSA